MVRTNFQEFIGDVHVLSNLQVGSNLFANDLAANVLTVDGSIGSTFFIGDGGLLSNIATTLNDIVANPGGNTVSNTLVFESGADAISNTAIVTYANVGVSISNTNPTGEYQLSIGSNIFVNTHASNVLTVIGTIGSNLFIGDGGLLSNIATTLDQIVDQGNTVSNTIQFVSGSDTATSNTGIVTHKDVGISVSNVNPTGEFQFGVGANLFVNTYSSNVLTVEGNVVANTMILGSLSVTSAYGLNHVTAQGSVTSDTISLTNATTGLSASSNITAGGNVTAQTVITSANVEVGDRLKFASNVFVDDLRVADLAANLVTYDKTTGELMDSGGLFANKLAVVSVQPPSALTANATTVANHGTYTVTTSSLAANSNAWNVFDGDTAVEWLASTTSDHLYNASGNDGVYGGTSNLFAGNYIQSGASSAGEWLAIEFPYKTTLRHMKLTPPATVTSYPASANLYATNDSLTWIELTNWSAVNPVTSSNVQTVIVNASAPYKKYAMVVTKTNGSDTNTGLAKWDLFAESFSIDGGKISMAQQATTGGETVMDQSGPHGRLPKAVPLKKYPESHITFNWNTMEKFHNTTTGVGSYYIPGGGYKVSASSVYSQSSSSEGGAYGLYAPWKVFDRKGWQDPSIERYGWLSDSGKYSSSDGSVGSADTTTYNGSSTATGEWLELKLPKKIKLKSFSIVSMTHNSSDVQDRMPKTATLLGSNDGSTWSLINDVSLGIPTEGVWINVDVNATEYYKYIRFVVTSTHADGTPAFTDTGFTELEYYGYEEDLPAGDTSVDTTFTSIMNTPQTTGANVYVDGSLGETFTNRVPGLLDSNISNTHTTYVSAGKYWELSGNVESNVTIEANTFLSGDAPHSVSVWFNSSNLEANTANTCVFSISDQEKLDSVNLDLQSNTWHNLTYAYQGEGGSRVTYLDGRKVAEEPAEDTFRDYPPFPMTGYSQGGYVVSVSSTLGNSTTDYLGWWAFNSSTTTPALGWVSADPVYTGSSYTAADPRNLGTDSGGAATVNGEYIILEMPHSLRVSYAKITHRSANNDRSPASGRFYGSNDGINWEEIKQFSGITAADYTAGPVTIIINSNKSYKKVALVPTGIPTQSADWVGIGNLEYYGHRENDLVRLPDPTNVLKYPHIAMTGPAQRGYVATASSKVNDNNQYGAWGAFNGNVEEGTSEGWVSEFDTYNNANPSLAVTSGSLATQFNSRYGDYINIKLPHKILLSKIHTFPRTGNENPPIVRTNEHPDAGYLYGSNDGFSTFQEIYSFDGVTVSSTYNVPVIHTIPSSHLGVNLIAYDEYRFQITRLKGQNRFAVVSEMELYGTEEATPVPIQIGGGNIDKVANFRVYDKFIGEDQALEIWDAQKDVFREVKNSMTLHKGRLGIGTTEPEGRLAVADEPDPDAYGLQEFPPKPLVANYTHIEGHGIFRASASRESSASLQAYEAFDGVIDVSSIWDSSAGADQYSESTGDYIGSDITTTIDGGSISGTFIQLEMPYKVKLQSISILAQKANSASFFGGARMPKTGSVVGSNDGVNWYLIASISKTEYTDGVFATFQTASTTFYSYFRLIAQTITQGSDSTWRNRFNLSGFKLFGYREQVTKQSVLHDGQLTLTKSLTVPRIGPALDADDTPRRDRLVVEYNTSTNPTFEGVVRDTSGRGNDGAFYGTAGYSAADKAFDFDGTGDYIQTRINNHSGDYIHSASVWFKTNKTTSAIGTNEETLFQIGNDFAAGVNPYVSFYNNLLYYAWHSHNIYCATTDVVQGGWNHVCVTYTGGGSSLTSRKIYLNGKVQTATLVGTSGTLLNLPKDTFVTLGAKNRPTDTIHYLDGAISNFKLYDTTLTAQEVKTLYDMGRCDEGHHVVNFSKTRVGIGLGDGEAPSGVLDVRGDLNVNGLINGVDLSSSSFTTGLDIYGASMRARIPVYSLPLTVPSRGGIAHYSFTLPTVNVWTHIFTPGATSMYALWIKIGQSDNTTSSGVFGIVMRHSYYDNGITVYGHGTGGVQMSSGQFQAIFTQNSGGYGGAVWLSLMRIM